MLGLIHAKQVEAAAGAKTSGSRRPWFRDAMHWVRRIHLYSGLFMFPWVMLYGITALLFNHPGAFPDQPGRTLLLKDFQGTPLESLSDPAADSEKVIAALNAKSAASEQSQPPYRLVNPEKARYARDRISARVRGEGQEHTVLYDLPSGTAEVRTEQQSAAERAPFAMRGLKTAGSLSERVKTGLPKALARQGLAAEEAGIAVGTDLVFYVEADGRPWRANYSIQTGSLTGAPADAADDLSLRQFLTQLHLSHGYATQGGAQWLWAVGVDAMFVSMVFWGVSGLLMFWQIKAVRRIGAIVASAGLILATLLALAMHHLFTA
jgi:hypothetical protein